MSDDEAADSISRNSQSIGQTTTTRLPPDYLAAPVRASADSTSNTSEMLDQTLGTTCGKANSLLPQGHNSRLKAIPPSRTKPGNMLLLTKDFRSADQINDIIKTVAIARNQQSTAPDSADDAHAVADFEKRYTSTFPGKQIVDSVPPNEPMMLDVIKTDNANRIFRRRSKSVGYLNELSPTAADKIVSFRQKVDQNRREEAAITIQRFFRYKRLSKHFQDLKVHATESRLSNGPNAEPDVGLRPDGADMGEGGKQKSSSVDASPHSGTLQDFPPDDNEYEERARLAISEFNIDAEKVIGVEFYVRL